MVENEEFRVEINAEHFPDEIFREFVKTNFDKDRDGFLSEKEIRDVVEINLAKRDISDLTGIKHFTFLKQLKCSGTEIQELNVSHSPSLELLNCSHTQIKVLDVSHNSHLKWLNCSGTQIKVLDVSHNPSLEWL